MVNDPFARSMAELAEQPNAGLSERQRETLRRLVYRYRRQILARKGTR